jgi:hypothetical protein
MITRVPPEPNNLFVPVPNEDGALSANAEQVGADPPRSTDMLISRSFPRPDANSDASSTSSFHFPRRAAEHLALDFRVHRRPSTSS